MFIFFRLLLIYCVYSTRVATAERECGADKKRCHVLDDDRKNAACFGNRGLDCSRFELYGKKKVYFQHSKAALTEKAHASLNLLHITSNGDVQPRRQMCLSQLTQPRREKLTCYLGATPFIDCAAKV